MGAVPRLFAAKYKIHAAPSGVSFAHRLAVGARPSEESREGEAAQGAVGRWPDYQCRFWSPAASGSAAKIARRSHVWLVEAIAFCDRRVTVWAKVLVVGA
ncbi:MAG: hypothetical protein K8L91_27110 [Anaerolineae bacterium]|nr:hypothetical protein [Anaerolineae bacterium]